MLSAVGKTAEIQVQREDVLRQFELMFIVDGTVSEEDAGTVATAVQSFISVKGTVLRTDAWGRRRLAYPINKKTDGYYWVVAFECEPGDVDALKYQLRVNEKIVRWIVTRPERGVCMKPAEAATLESETSLSASTAAPEALISSEPASEGGPISEPEHE